MSLIKRINHYIVFGAVNHHPPKGLGDVGVITRGHNPLTIKEGYHQEGKTGDTYPLIVYHSSNVRTYNEGMNYKGVDWAIVRVRGNWGDLQKDTLMHVNQNSIYVVGSKIKPTEKEILLALAEVRSFGGIWYPLLNDDGYQNRIQMQQTIQVTRGIEGMLIKHWENAEYDKHIKKEIRKNGIT